MPNRTSKLLLAAYQRIHALLTARGFRLQYQRLDKEASQEYKQILTSMNINFQLTPAGSHQRNCAERAI
jgi:hypothetical protein